MSAHEDAAKLEALMESIGAVDWQRKVVRGMLHQEQSQQFIPLRLGGQRNHRRRGEPTFMFVDPAEFEPFYADDKVYDMNGNPVMDEAATMPTINVSDLLRNAMFDDVMRSAQRLMDTEPQSDIAKKYPNAIDVGEITYKKEPGQ